MSALRGTRRLVAFSILGLAVFALPLGAEDWTSLFDGKTLDGWKGMSELWTVKDGAVVGSTAPDGRDGNTFLVAEQDYGNFILELEFMLVSGNSGVQIRSETVGKPDDFVIRGYQADMGAGYYGSLYDERRRGMLAKAPGDLVRSRFLKEGRWNRYSIHCQGNKTVLRLNGLITAEYTETDDSIPRRGLVALQLHGGGPMEVRFKNIRIREIEPKRLLYVTTAAGFAHSSRPLSRKVVEKLARDSGVFEAVTTDSTELITPEGLSGFDAVLFYTTGGKSAFPLTPENREHLIQWVKNGHAFAGVHSATDTYGDWEPYWDMIGGTFDGHPWHETIKVDIEDPSHPAAQPLPHEWEIKDEIYQLKNYSRDRIHVILSMNEASIKSKGKRADKDYAIAWCREFGKGKVFYTSLGHREDVWTNEHYQQHLLGGLRWILGDASGDVTPGLEKPANEFVSLFDGKTLSGWTPNSVDSAETQWFVTDAGTLSCRGPKKGHSFSPKEYTNFHYKAEAKIGPNGNSGMYFRARKGQGWPAGFEAQVNTSHGDTVRTGSLYSIKKEFRQLVPEDTWFTQEVIAYGSHVLIKVNGKITADAVVPTAERKRMNWKQGHFAFQFHDPACKVEYRNIVVRELPVLAPVTNPLESF